MAETVLFLDGFDEDPQAIGNHTTRIEELMEGERFSARCRTQFLDSSIWRGIREQGSRESVPVPHGRC